jgi:hypothetical protein
MTSGESEPDLSMAKWQNALTYMNVSTIFASSWELIGYV